MAFTHINACHNSDVPYFGLKWLSFVMMIRTYIYSPHSCYCSFRRSINTSANIYPAVMGAVLPGIPRA